MSEVRSGDGAQAAGLRKRKPREPEREVRTEPVGVGAFATVTAARHWSSGGAPRTQNPRGREKTPQTCLLLAAAKEAQGNNEFGRVDGGLYHGCNAGGGSVVCR